MLSLSSDSKHEVIHSWPIWLTAIIGIAAVMAWPAMSAPILLDDEDGFRHAAQFKGWLDIFQADAFGLFRPVKNAIFYGFGQQEDINLTTWHGLILTFFLLSILAVFAFLRTLLRSDLGALIGTTIWGLTPTQSCLAVWMRCLNISMCVTFIVGFLLLHIRACRSSKRLNWHHASAVLLMFLAQSSYETAVVGVGLAFLIDEIWLEKRPLKERMGPYALYTVVTIAFLSIRFAVGASMEVHSRNVGFDPDIEPWQLTASAGWFTQQHLLMWIAPLGRIEFASCYLWGLSASSLEISIAWILMLGLLTGAWFLRKPMPLVSLGIFWFFLTGFPSSNVIPIAAGPIEDYYLIIPSMGLTLAFVSMLHWILQHSLSKQRDGSSMRRPLFLILAGGLVLSRAFLIPFFGLQAAVWKEPLELYLRVTETRPYQFSTKALAARELLNDQRFEEAAFLAGVAASEGPWYSPAHLVKGMALRQTGEIDEAIEALQQVISLNSAKSLFHQSASLELANIYASTKDDWAEARRHLLSVLEHGNHENRILAIHKLAEVYRRHKMAEKAIETLQRGIKLYPEHVEFHEHVKAIRSDDQGPQDP